MTDIFDQITAKPDASTEPESASQPAENGAQGELCYTPQALKNCAQELLKFGLLEMDQKPRLYQVALTQQVQLNAIFEPFDLVVRLDDVRGLAFLVMAGTLLQDENIDEWTHPLVRRQRLNLEQSLLLAILRKRFLAHEQEVAVGAEALVDVDDLIAELQTFLGELGSDAQEQKRLRNLLEKLKAHGVVSEVDANDQVGIRPIIAHVANPENLANLLSHYRHLGKA